AGIARKLPNGKGLGLRIGQSPGCELPLGSTSSARAKRALRLTSGGPGALAQRDNQAGIDVADLGAVGESLPGASPVAVPANHERRRLPEQTAPDTGFSQASALGHLGRLVQHHEVRPLAEDAIQKLQIPLLELSARLDRIADDAADAA